VCKALLIYAAMAVAAVFSQPCPLLWGRVLGLVSGAERLGLCLSLVLHHVRGLSLSREGAASTQRGCGVLSERQDLTQAHA
jgi:hypothetical protein